MPQWNRAAVRRALDRLSLDELQSMAFDQGYDFAGKDKTSLVLGLPTWLAERNRETELVDWLRENRPDIDLSAIYREPAQPPVDGDRLTIRRANQPRLTDIVLPALAGLVAWFIAWYVGTAIAWGISPAELSLWEETVGGIVGGAFGGFATLLYLRLARGVWPLKNALLIPVGWAIGWGLGYCLWLLSSRSGAQYSLAALLGYLTAASLGALSMVVAGRDLTPYVRWLDGAMLFAGWMLAWGIQTLLRGYPDLNGDIILALAWGIGGACMFGWLAWGSFLSMQSSPP